MADDIFESLLGDVGTGAFEPSKPVEQDPIFSSVMDEVASADRAQKAIAVKQGMRAMPEQYADHLNLSKTFGVSVDFVGRNADRLKEFKGAQDLTKLMDSNPPLAKWYMAGDNPQAIKVDELRQLSGLSWLVASARQAGGEGITQTDLADLRYRQMMGLASGDEVARADKLSAEMEPRTFGADSWLEKGWVGTAQQLPIMFNSFMGGLEGGAQGAVAGAAAALVAGQLGPQVAVPEEIVTVPGAAAVGFNYGSIAGQWQSSFKMESGLAYDEFKQFRDENGALLDDDVARVAAIVAGGSASLLETYSFRKMASVIPGFDKVAGMVGKDAVAQALTKPAVREALKTFAGNVFKTGVTEVSTETLQEAFTMFAGEAAKAFASEDGAEFANISPEDAADRLRDTLTQTLQTMTIMAPGLASSRLGHDISRSRVAARDLLILEQLNTHAKGNELNARLPEKSKEAIQALTEGGPIQNVYVPTEALNTYFQTSEEASRFAASVGLTEEYNEAQRLGRDMEIPIEAYYVNIAGTEIGEALKRSAKFSPERMSVDDAEMVNEAWRETQDTLRADYEAGIAADKSSMEADEVIFDDVKNKAMDAGIVPDQAAQYAKLYSTFFRVMSQRSGTDAGELYRSYGFDIKRALPSSEATRRVDNMDLAIEVARQGKGKIDPLRKAVRKAAGPSMLDAVIARGGILDTGGELAAMDAPKSLVRPAQMEFDSSWWTGSEAPADDSNEFSADDVVRQMWEEGYFPEFEERPTPDDLFGAIRDALSGKDRFSPSYDRRGEPAMQQTAGLVAFVDMLDQLGIDPAALDNDAVRAAIDQAVNADPETAALFQSVQAPVTETPEFKAWFGDSKVVDEDGNPLLVYRGEHGDSDMDFHSALPSLSFASQETANLYAQNPNDRKMTAKAPRVTTVYLRIENPIFENRDDPYVDFEDLIEKIGADAVIELALRHGGHVTNTNNWEENFSDTYDSVSELIEQEPERLDELYMDAYVLLDDPAFVEAAKAAGYDGGIHIGNGASADDVEYRIFDASQAKSPFNSGAFDPNDARILNQEKGVKRGSIQLANGRTVVNLFDQADLSTFLHESGHFFLEVLRDLATSPNAPSDLVADWAITRDYLGLGEDGTIPTEAHERFARSFEAYLFEGKSPSREVADIMSRFRSWLVFVYKSVRKLNAPINDKIRGVMDRLIATDEEIAAAQTGAEFRPAFKDAASAGMTDAQWQVYTKAAARAVDEAKAQMDERLLSEIARETTKEWRDAKREIRDEVAGQLEQLPVYRVINYLRTGEGAPDGTERMHLDKGAILTMFGEGAFLRLPKSVPPLYRNKGGVHPDILAELFGFASGHEMLSLMMSVKPIGKAIVEETNLRMRQRFGDSMGDAVARARIAAEAVANDVTGELINAEIGVLIKKGLATTKATKEDARRAARSLVRGKTIREALRIKLYQNANAKAAGEAERAILAGKWAAALAAKKRQLLNHYVVMEAAEAQKEVEAAVKYINRFTGRKRPKSIWPDHMDQIEALLERFDFRKSISLKDEQRRTSLAAWIADQEAAGELVVIPDVVRNDAFRKPYRSMTVDDLLAVRDAVKNIEHLGRRWAAVHGDIEARKFNGRRDELVSSLAASQPLKPEAKTRNPTKFDDIVSLGRSLEASLLKMESVFDWMDGGDINGPFRRLVWQRIADAEAKENELRKSVVGKFMEALGGLDRARLNERVTVPGLSQTFLRSDIIAVALNMGNESNLDKMMRGEGWSRAVVDRIVSNLNAEEAAAVQKVWDIVNSFWPEIAALQRRLSGVEPPKVEAQAVEIAGVKLAGGYYPMIYDPKRSADVQDRGAAAADRMFENTYLRPETMHGFTNERAQAYTRPLLLDLDGAARHLTAVIHDLTHREAILDGYKLMTNPTVRAEIEARYGQELYGQVVPWFQSIAHDAHKDEGLSAVEQMFRGIRSRATIMGMGFRVTTMLAQIAGYSSSLEMVPVKAMVGAMKDFTMSPRAMWEEVNRKSGEMRFRSANLDRDIRDQLKTLTGKTTVADQAKQFAFYGIGFMDRIVTVPTWTAAYRDHLQRMPADEEGAVAHADQVVRLSQGSGGPKDLAAIARKNELTKLVTMFYSYFSAYYNRQRKWGRDARRKLATGEGSFADLLARQVFMTIGPAVVAELLVGRGPDDDEDWSTWAARKVAFYPLSAVPIGRDAFGVFERGFGYSFTPAARTIDELLIQPFKLLGDAMDGELEPRKAVKQTIDTVGFALALPLGQLSSTVDNVWKGLEADDFQLRDIVISRPKQ